MATVSTQEKTVIPYSISGDYRIDVLLGLDSNNFATRWNSPNAVGTPAAVTYSFMNSAPTYATDGDKKGFIPFSEEQKTATKQILALVSQQINITFKEVIDTTTNFGAICFSNNSQGPTSAGYAFYPDVAEPLGKAGDMYINGDDASNLQGLMPGTFAYATLVHELCHAIGLKHPGNYNAGEPASTEAGNFLIKTEDSALYTVMSYVDAPQNQQCEFLGSYDLLALKYLYGKHAYNDTDTTYKYTDASGQNLILINDTGGTDTIDLSAIVLGVKIDLNAGKFSSIGVLIDGLTAAIDNVSIDFDTIIENAVGTALDDTIIGNSANNQLKSGVGNDNITGGGGSDTITGGAGADSIDGGEGADVAVFTGSSSQYTASTENGALILISASEGMDRISNVEYFQFSDGNFTAAMLTGSEVKTPVVILDIKTPIVAADHNTLNGTVGNDTLYGKTAADEINGLADNDALYGYNGNDTLNGGAGYDYLVGGKGDDTLNGGADVDAVDYYYYDTTGSVTVNLALGTATGAGIGADSLVSIETVYGSYYADTLIGDSNTNYLCGIDGNDKLDGAGGDDSLWGWIGNDSLSGGSGNDLLYGGYGADTFYFASNQGVDTIEDFYTPLDKIAIVAGTNGITTPEQALSHLSTNSAGSAVLDLGQGNTVTLPGVLVLWITGSMFTIA